MTSMRDLSEDLVEEILSKVLITSLGAVRSTCKGWNALSKNRILCKGEPKHQFLGFMMKKYKLFSMKFDLHGILYEDSDEEFVNPSIKEIGNFLNHAKISQIYHCDGLLLCVTMDNSRLVIWNPYLGQTKWIHLKTRTKSTYALGYDTNKNHKILKFSNNNQGYYEVYDGKSSSWTTFTVIPNWDIDCDMLGSSIDGNSYFWTRKRIVVEGSDSEEDDDDPYYLICFDFTAETFGQFLPLPFQYPNDYEDSRIFSCVKGEKLAVLYQQCHTSMIEVWITTKIVPGAVSWTLFLKVDITPLIGLGFHFYENSCFFIDVEKKLAVVFDLAESDIYKTSNSYIIGDKGYLKKVTHGKFKAFPAPLMCSSCYAPSLVQIDDPIARRERNRKWKSNIKEWKRMKKN